MKRYHTARYILPALLLIAIESIGQKKLIVLGSSTSACWSVSDINNCYVNRLVSHYQATTPITLDNRAVGGWNVYKSMPEGYVPPPGRDVPVDYFNISDAVAANPDAIIINYPSNGYDVFTVAETMQAFRTISATAKAAGINCFITTTQPRNNFTDAQRDKLRMLKDSILLQFGPYAIDFWTDITNAADNTIKPEYQVPGDPVHVNDAAHEKFFERVVNSRLFASAAELGALPLKFVYFKSEMTGDKVNLSWKIAEALNVSHFFIQKSTGDGFRDIGSTGYNGNADTYGFTDSYTVNGNNSYRIAVVDKDQKRQYSSIINVIRASQGLVQMTWSKNEQLLRINSDQIDKVVVQILNSAGQVLFSRTVLLNKGLNNLPVNLKPANNVHVLTVKGNKWQSTNVLSFVD